jgi:hypothetical protein
MRTATFLNFLVFESTGLSCSQETLCNKLPQALIFVYLAGGAEYDFRVFVSFGHPPGERASRFQQTVLPGPAGFPSLQSEGILRRMPVLE